MQKKLFKWGVVGVKFLVIGLGSMGKRRIRCLKSLGYSEIAGYDQREDRISEAAEKYGIDTYNSIDKAFLSSPDAAIISTPPDMHMYYAIMCAEKNINFFTEASVVDDEMDNLIKILEEKNITGVPSCTMRFYPAIQLIKKIVDHGEIGKLSTFTYHSGQYLPDWHPWEEISEFYVSKKETGGCREIVPFELCWITWVFGKISEVSGIHSKTININAEIDDVYQALLKFENGFYGHLLVDVVSRSATRKFRLIGQEGLIEWNWDDGFIRKYTAQTRKWEDLSYESGSSHDGYNKNLYEEMYIKEIGTFINAINKSSNYEYDYKEDKYILNILYAIEKSTLNRVKE